MSLVPPPEAHDPAAWVAGYTARVLHRAAPGVSLCPYCRHLWPCANYLLGVLACQSATRPAKAIGRVRWPV